MKLVLSLITLLLLTGSLFAQDKAFYQKQFIWDRERTILTGDFSKIPKPTLDDFDRVFAFPPTHQDTTGTCWSFSTTSFLESEIYRLHQKKVKLSEIFFAYWDYVEKARRFVQEKGDSEFGEGSESNAVLLKIKKYGMMPESAYTGLLNGATRHNHGPMFEEMNNYLKFVKSHGYWDETVVIKSIRAIMDKYIGRPPETFEYEGRVYNAPEFRDKVCAINPDDYVGFMSTLKYPFYTKDEYEAPDNYWHSKEYHNVPLDVFYNTIKSNITRHYSMVIGGDVSEPGKYGWEDIAIIVPWDLPQSAINQSSRELRIYNHTTQDDHGIHLLGFTHKDDHDWFLIKDSGSSSRYGKYSGYYFFRDDFIKLKMLTFMVHKDAVKDLLAKFNEE